MMACSPIDQVLSKLKSVTRTGKGWKARCPAHDDHNPSLSISECDDGTVMVKCWSGCTTESVCESIGLTLSDLFPDRAAGGGSRPAPKRQTRTYPTGKASIADLERRNGKASKVWRYQDALGNVIGAVARWDRPDGKDIRPVSRRSDGLWVIGAMPEPRLLYQLPTLADAATVYVCEGEKAADAISGLGLVATTSAGGANAAGKSDWSPLAGKEVIILPDNDPPGETYADDVCRLLQRLEPAPIVKIVRLAGLPAGGDAVEWIDSGGTRDELLRLAEATEPIKPEPAEGEAPEPFPSWEPFPVDCLPEPVQSLVVAGAKAIGCDESYIALPALSVCAAAIGSTRRLKIRESWRVPAILWMAVVADSGSGKSPAFRLATRPVRERQQRLIEDAIECSKTERVITSNATIEALSVLLRDNPRGLLMAVDELAGWFASFGQYNSRSIGDAAAWLSLFDGESFVIDRKTGEDRTIAVPRTAVSVCGTIQPAILRKSLSADHRESGLAARLLMAFPPRKAKRWTEDDVEECLQSRYAAIVDRLFDLQGFTHPETGRLSSIELELSREAKEEFVAFYNSHNEEQADLSGDLAAAWSKLEQVPARLALVLHCIKQAARESVDPGTVDAATMRDAIRLTDWFKSETLRVYGMLSESETDRERRKLIEWIERKGGRVTVREVARCCSWLKRSGAAEEALTDLVDAGFGRWEAPQAGPAGGRPTRQFVLSTNRQSTKPRIFSISGGFVDVDNVDNVDEPPKAPESEEIEL